jgi:hypothetical protein
MAEQETGNGFQKRPNNVLLIPLVFIIHYYFNFFFIILIKTKHKNAVWVQIHSSNLVIDHLHHRRFEFLAKNIRIYSKGEHQRAYPHRRAGSHRAAVRIGFTDVCQQGKTECPSYPLIWQWHLTYPAKRDLQDQGLHKPVNNEYT